MSRCRQTDALLSAVFAEDGPTAAQADHVTGCPECARALALARRFDGELHRIGGAIAGHPPTEKSPGGGRHMWRGVALAGTVVAVMALVIGSIQLWRDGSTAGVLQAGGPRAEQVAAWLDRALVAAHAQAQPGGTDLDGWEPGRVEVCGDAAIAFFDRGGDGSHGYLWAVGRPSSLVEQSIETGWSRTLSALDVAGRRAELPVCDVVLDEAREPAGADLPVAPHLVVRVPDLFWIGDPEDAPVEVEVVGGDRGAPVEVGIARDAYLYARLDDASIRAVDIVAADGRYRYTVGVPGFTVWANVVDDAVRFEFLNEPGDIVRAGPIVDWPDDAALGDRERAERDARRQAEEAARRTAAELRWPQVLASGQTCRDWRVLGDETQVLLTEELIGERLKAVRISQQLPEGATISEMTTAARASLDKSCQGSPADRLLADIVDALYPEE